MVEIAVSGVVERDIDFLLVEEFAASRQFVEWFLQRIGIVEQSEVVAIAHSATTSTGETDIELTISTTRGIVMVLLENKIAANLQPRQAERYRERAVRYVKEGQCSRCATVLVAPQVYFAGEPQTLGFDHVLPYEDILDWFDHAEELGERRQPKIALLRRAIDRGSAGWKLVPDETATEFWRRYWELTRTLAPELRMPRPEVKPANSAFIYFRPAGLPRGVTLVHKLTYGYVDLQLAGKAATIDDVKAKYDPLLEPGMSVEAAGKSAVIRLTVPPIDMRAPFLDSEGAVREGIWAAKLINVWFKRAGP
jgi:hypothetical protein